MQRILARGVFLGWCASQAPAHCGPGVPPPPRRRPGPHGSPSPGRGPWSVDLGFGPRFSVLALAGASKLLESRFHALSTTWRDFVRLSAFGGSQWI
jgi:hypothetical protein